MTTIKTVCSVGGDDDASPFALSLPGGSDPNAHLDGKRMGYWGNGQMVPGADVPFADRGPLIVSKKIVDVLTRLGVDTNSFLQLDVYIHPDWSGESGPPWRRSGSPRLIKKSKYRLIAGEYFVLADLPIVDCIDWSHYSGEHGVRVADPEITGVLRPVGDFSPLFVVEHALGTPYWITTEAKRALARAGVRGLAYGRPVRVREAPDADK